MIEERIAKLQSRLREIATATPSPDATTPAGVKAKANLVICARKMTAGREIIDEAAQSLAQDVLRLGG